MGSEMPKFLDEVNRATLLSRTEGRGDGTKVENQANPSACYQKEESTIHKPRSLG